MKIATANGLHPIMKIVTVRLGERWFEEFYIFPSKTSRQLSPEALAETPI